MTTAIIEAKLAEYTGIKPPSDLVRLIASALADARRADVEVVRTFLREPIYQNWEPASAALSRLAGET